MQKKKQTKCNHTQSCLCFVSLMKQGIKLSKLTVSLKSTIIWQTVILNVNLVLLNFVICVNSVTLTALFSAFDINEKQSSSALSVLLVNSPRLKLKSVK